MRPLFRHMLTFCSAASAVLLVVVLVVWVRSWNRFDAFYYQPRIDNALHLYKISWGRGRLSIGRFVAENEPLSRLYWSSAAPTWLGPAGPGETGFLGIRLFRGTEAKWHPIPASRVLPMPPYTKVRETAVSLPCWQAAALSACLPANWLLRRRRRQIARLRSERGQCTRCAYDLRASPGRCPECGEAPWIWTIKTGTQLLCLDPPEVRRPFGSAFSTVVIDDAGCRPASRPGR